MSKWCSLFSKKKRFTVQTGYGNYRRRRRHLLGGEIYDPLEEGYDADDSKPECVIAETVLRIIEYFDDVEFVKVRFYSIEMFLKRDSLMSSSPFSLSLSPLSLKERKRE